MAPAAPTTSIISLLLMDTGLSGFVSLGQVTNVRLEQEELNHSAVLVDL